MYNEKLIEEWKKGWTDGEKSVLQFLEEIEGLDIKKKYYQWANADEYTNKKGEIIKRTN